MLIGSDVDSLTALRDDLLDWCDRDGIDRSASLVWWCSVRDRVVLLRRLNSRGR